MFKALRGQAGGGTPVATLAPRAPAIIVMKEEQPPGRSPDACSCSIHLCGAQGHSAELASMHAQPVFHDSHTFGDASCCAPADHLHLKTASSLRCRRLSEMADHEEGTAAAARGGGRSAKTSRELRNPASLSRLCGDCCSSLMFGRCQCKMTANTANQWLVLSSPSAGGNVGPL